MALELTGEEFETIRDNFKEIDTDGDGKLTKEELTASCIKQNDTRTEEEIEYMMRMMDLDNSGTIEFPEFLEMVAFFEYNHAPYEVQIKQMFRSLDRNGDGFISKEEVGHLWKIFINDNWDLPSEEEIEGIIQALDVNCDGKIDYDEFMSKFDFDLM